MVPVVKMTILILAAILIGFAIGRRLGIQQGFHVGMAYGVLDTRRQCLEQGHCPVCSSPNELKDKHSITDGDTDAKSWGSTMVLDKPNIDVTTSEFEALWLQDVTL